MRVEVSEEANADLDDILDYGAERFGEDVAEAYVRQFQQVYDLISEHPLLGVRHETVRPPIRNMPCGSHRVYYDVLDEYVMVRRILHKAMDVERHL